MVRALRLAVLVVTFSIARADDPPVAPNPWTIGVTPEQKATAQQHLEAGNALFLQRKYSEALAEYERAVGAWNHPAIRFNMVRCLVFLEKPLEAFDSLELALKYGAGPFDASIYGDVLAYQKMLEAQIGHVEVSCTEPGVEMTLDGAPLPACPTSIVRRVKPGNHQVVGRKPGFVPRTIELEVFGGQRDHAVMSLDPLSKVARTEHRWAKWKPLAVIGGGLAVAGIGGLFRLKAVGDNDAYRDFVSRECPDGCDTSMLDRSLQDSARLENRIAVGLIALGVATVATGGMMLYLNRGRTVYDLDSKPRSIDVTPTPGGAAVTVTGRF